MDGILHGLPNESFVLNLLRNFELVSTRRIFSTPVGDRRVCEQKSLVLYSDMTAQGGIAPVPTNQESRHKS